MSDWATELATKLLSQTFDVYFPSEDNRTGSVAHALRKAKGDGMREAAKMIETGEKFASPACESIGDLLTAAQTIEDGKP